MDRIGSSTAFLFEGTLHSAKDVEEFDDEKEDEKKKEDLTLFKKSETRQR